MCCFSHFLLLLFCFGGKQQNETCKINEQKKNHSCTLFIVYRGHSCNLKMNKKTKTTNTAQKTQWECVPKKLWNLLLFYFGRMVFAIVFYLPVFFWLSIEFGWYSCQRKAQQIVSNYKYECNLLEKCILLWVIHIKMGINLNMQQADFWHILLFLHLNVIVVRYNAITHIF